MNDKSRETRPDSDQVEVLSHPGSDDDSFNQDRPDTSGKTTVLVMEALERLASATDRVAQQVREHLGDMRQDLSDDMADQLLRRVMNEGESFWPLVQKPYLDGTLDRDV